MGLDITTSMMLFFVVHGYTPFPVVEEATEDVGVTEDVEVTEDVGATKDVGATEDVGAICEFLCRLFVKSQVTNSCS